MDTLLAFSLGTTVAILGLGFLLGLKHATEADHLAAVSTIVSERRSLFSSAIIGATWGLGHTISLLAAGTFVLLLNYEISERTERILEFCVGVMLVMLGLNVLRKLLSGGHLHFHQHGHADREHAHPHLHAFDETADPASHHGLRFTPRPLLVGMVHGMAGSAALMLLVIPTIRTAVLGLLYIAVFGIGSIGGMMLMSFIVGLPFHLTAAKFHRFNHLLQASAGLLSVALGLWIIYEKGFSQGLLA